MGRTRGFDEMVVVQRAAGVFLGAGYAATSVDALAEATGLHRGSLYGAFGSKRGLFMAAVELVGSEHLAADESTDLLLVALLEMAPTDPAVRTLARRLVDALPPPAAPLLGNRLLERAGVSSSDAPLTEGTP